MTITAAADGSALGNPGPNGWAWYIDDANWAAGGSPHGTNNQGELQAVLELLRATAEVDEPLQIMCDSKYVIDSITKWMPGWKRRGWRKADGAPVLNRDLMEALDAAMQGRDVDFVWVKGHAGHELNEAADQRANAASKAYQAKREPNRGPGFTMGSVDAGTTVPASDLASAAAAPASEPLWAEASDLFDGWDAAPAEPIDLSLTLTAEEHARLRDRADAQSISLVEALRRLI
ncbi:ribonuclease H family protein [Microbacterium sp. GXF6406]